MQKGFYFIGTYQEDKKGHQFYGPELEEGSIENKGKLFIHRKSDYEGNPNKWRVSHLSSGACILADIDLKSARLIANKLQRFKIFNIKKFIDIQDAILDARDNPESPYHEEYKQIIQIRFIRV